jgi:hypothetical protein
MLLPDCCRATAASPPTLSGLSAQFKTLVLEHKALTEEEFWSSSAMLKVAGVAGMHEEFALAFKT